MGNLRRKRVYTIGHSTRSFADLLSLLKAHAIHTVIDVRTIPRSRHCPQFNSKPLQNKLKKHKIGYRHMKDLGGLRHAKKDSSNTGWINPSFRGFADYMQTPAFEKALHQLEKIAEKKPCVLMCAEAIPWRCHRNLIADALTMKKWKVFHIQSRKTAKQHRLTPFLHRRKGLLIYK